LFCASCGVITFESRPAWSKVDREVILPVDFGAYCRSTPAARSAARSAALMLCAGSSSIGLLPAATLISPVIFDSFVDDAPESSVI
jgi:hypothetical protein